MIDPVVKPLPVPPIPEALRRQGLRRVTHNLPDGFEVSLAGDFARIFKDEIERRGQRP